MTMSMLAEPSTLQLYDFQLEAVDALRDGLRNGHKRQMLCAPTGAGKTEIAIHLMQEAERAGSRVVFFADRVTLVDQTSRRLSGYGLMHGIIQANNSRGTVVAYPDM